MPRTTIDIDATVLRELRRRQKSQRKTMGRLVSELLTSALRVRPVDTHEPFHWQSQPMNARVDLDDKEAVRRVVEGA